MHIHEVEAAFSAFLFDHGIELKKPPVADGRLHREHIQGHKSGTLNAAYRLFPDGVPNGWFKDHKSGLEIKWISDAPKQRLTPEELRQLKADQAKREAERQATEQAAQLQAAATAKRLWHEADPVTEAKQHGYLTQKGIQPHHARLLNKATLIWPIYDSSKRLVNLQLIKRNGQKRFLKNGRKAGCYGLIGQPKTGDKILVAEGFATAASLHEATGHPAFVALDKGNLLPVAQLVRSYFPAEIVVICADADPDGGGQKAAKAAAQAIGGLYCEPPEIGQDFNDLAREVDVGQ